MTDVGDLVEDKIKGTGSKFKVKLSKDGEITYNTIADMDELVADKIKSPLDVNVIPNNMGINLCAVDSIEWERQGDGQLIYLTINFIPDND